MARDRILYLSHVDQRWIKQRPQFLAQQLALDSRLLFVYARAWGRKGLSTDRFHGRSVPYVGVPNRLQAAIPILDHSIQALYAVVLALIWRPNIVLIGHPRLGHLARLIARLAGANLIYDSMDRVSLLPGANSRTVEAEVALWRQAKLISASSEGLAQDIEGVVDRPIVLLPNAIDDPERWQFPNTPEHATNTIGYWGTISEWFDWDIVIRFLDEHPEWDIHLWGPLGGGSIPNHPQVHWNGVASHDELRVSGRKCDVLLMPFKRSRLTDAVDPVKAYEYLATGRPVVLTSYPATQRFGQVCELYQDGSYSSFANALENAVADSGPDSVARRISFAFENTWDVRARDLMRAYRSLP